MYPDAFPFILSDLYNIFRFHENLQFQYFFNYYIRTYWFETARNILISHANG